MRILMTGHTTFQCGINRPINHLYSGASALYYGLRDEHEVDNLPPTTVMANLSLEKYDIILCGLYAAASISSRYGETCLLMLDMAEKSGKRVVFYLDDWHLNLMSSGYRNLSMPSKAYQLARHARLLYKNSPWLDIVLDNMDNIQRTMHKIQYNKYADGNMRVLIPMLPWCEDQLRTNVKKHFSWGDDTIILYDPTELFPKFDVRSVSPDDKSREWVVSSRYDQTKFIGHLKSSGMTWPTKSYGCKKTGDEILKNELDLPNEAYAPRWGILSHAYPASMQGQWRNRFMFACMSQSIIYCEGAEAGRGLLPSGGISEIERMSNIELRNLAQSQKSWIDSRTWPLSKLKFLFNNILEAR